MSFSATEWIARLELVPHPEGGHYRETFRSINNVTPLNPSEATALHERAAITSILFLLEAQEISRLHRIDADELWYWHAGFDLRVEVILPNGHHRTHCLGPEASLQCAVPAGSWFGAELPAGSDWALVGCAVAPGFEFSRFELAQQTELLALYPEHEALIKRFTRT
jgi:predicted cupin superfamily sugar epimerase